MTEANQPNSLLGNKLIITQRLADFAGEQVSSCIQCEGIRFLTRSCRSANQSYVAPCQAIWARYANNRMSFSPNELPGEL